MAAILESSSSHPTKLLYALFVVNISVALETTYPSLSP